MLVDDTGLGDRGMLVDPRLQVRQVRLAFLHLTTVAVLRGYEQALTGRSARRSRKPR